MKIYIKFLILIFFVSCQPKDKSEVVESDSYSFFVGTYTNNQSEGIYKFSLSEKGKIKAMGLAAKSENPSYLALSDDKKYLIAVNEISDENGMGSVESFKIQDDKLSFINRSSSGGAHPCYVSLVKNSYVLTANYSGGNIGLLKLNPQGQLSDLLDVQQHSGQGTTDRQKGPHAHTVLQDPTNDLIVAADLGTNELWVSKIDPTRDKLMPAYPHKIQLDPGAGPRHIAFHPNGEFLYVINELDNTVCLMKRDEKEILAKGTPVTTLPSDFSGESYCADIHISSDGKFLYASNRGHNSIAVFKIVPENGKLIPKEHQDVQGDWPRNFALSPDGEFLIVANQRSGNLVSFKRNSENGMLEFVDDIEVPEAVCVLFLN